MNTKTYRPLAVFILLASVIASSAVLAKPESDACIALGALVYTDWTHPDAGGSGLPKGEANAEYLRCKSCHGWDRMGLEGGYVRRERTADQPNAGLGDPNTVTRDISPGRGHLIEIDIEDVLHVGTGRAYEDGSDSWVEPGDDPTAEELAAYAAGFTLGNLHPDFSTAGVNGDDIVLTQDQLECVVDFVNFADADPMTYFLEIDESRDPVKYVIQSSASAAAGEAFYADNCLRCHGEPEQNANGALPDGGFVTYLRQDGAYSEFVHQARWGIPGSVMSRAAIGAPGSQDMIDVMLYLQEFIADNSDFEISGGISGTWYLEARNGEGFLLDVAPEVDGSWKVVATYYTYDGIGNPVWLIGDAPALGSVASVPVVITDGGVFGSAFDPAAVSTLPWGTLEFSFNGCWSGHVRALPNDEMLNAGLGFEEVEFDITRLTPPDGCP